MNNTVYLCDCMDYMKGLPDNAFDLAIVDPPYGIGDKAFSRPGKNARPFSALYDGHEWTDTAPEKEYFIEIMRVASNYIIWGGNYFVLPPSRGFIYWDKVVYVPNFSAGELAYSSFQRPSSCFRHQWSGAFKASERGNSNIHPTQKPIALYKWLLKNYAKPGQTIFDSHVGSGSIRIACHDMGYDFTGCELDPDYHAAQEDRFNTHKAQGQLFDPVELTKNEYVQVAL